MNSSDYNVLAITMPTYLQDIFRSTELIRLIYKKIQPTSENLIGNVDMSPKNSTQSTSDLNLTGNPLEVDLDDDVKFDVIECCKKVAVNWTKEESTYGPLSSKEAGEYLNNSKESSLQVCLCDGKDPRKTLAIMLKQNDFYRGIIHFYGCYTISQQQVCFNTMLTFHQRYSRKDCKVAVEVNTLYAKFGHNKRLAEDVVHTAIGNSAFIEVSCPDHLFKSVNNKYKLFLQVNVSNTESRLYVLWQQLIMLYNLIEQLQDEDDLENLKISPNPKEYHEVADDIAELLRSYETKRHVHKREVDWKDLDVMNMREGSFMEKLWECLISFEGIHDVLQGFHTLFAALVNTPINYTEPAANKTTLGVVINGLIEGNMAVPTLNISVALKFLIELGLYKLHNDYLFLIRNMEPNGEGHFKEEWEKIVETQNQISKAATRKSRLTISKGNENIGDLMKQLNHTAYMHLTTEFMLLAMNCQLSGSTTLPQVYNCIFKCKHLKKTFKSLMHTSVVDFQCDLYSSQYDFIKDLPAVAINVRFFSEGRAGSTTTTIFHFSDKPIFPDTVYNDYGIDVEQIEEKQYYVHLGYIFNN